MLKLRRSLFFLPVLLFRHHTKIEIFLHPRKRRNTERGPEARRPESGGRPRGCGFEEQGGACTRIQRGVYPYTEGGSISYSNLSVCLSHPPTQAPCTPALAIPPLSTLTSRATHAHPTSPRSTGFCAKWDCISSSSSSSLSVCLSVTF